MSKIVAKIQKIVIWLLLLGVIVFSFPESALAAAGDGYLEYGSATVGEVGAKYRTWTEATTTWGGETAGPVTGPTVNWSVLKADPCNPGKLLLGFVENDGTDNLNFYSWDGDSWQAELTSTDQNATLDDYRAFDIAFENSGSCNPVIVYGLTGDPDRVYYREGSWDGTDYNLGTATENSFDYTNQIDTTYNRWHILCPQLATSKMILLSVGDATSTRNIAARIYDGSSFGTESPDLGMAGWLNATAPTNWDFDCAWETSTAEGMVAWGVYNTTNPYWKYITYTGGAWNAVTDGPNTGSIIGGAVRVLSLDGNPNSTGTYADDIAGGIIEATANDADGLIWDGSSWTRMTSIDTSAYGTVLGRQVDVKYAGTSDDAVLIYDNNTTADLDWSRSIDGAAWSAHGVQAITGATHEANILLVNETSDDKVMFIRTDSASDIYAYEYDMSADTWNATNGGNALEVDSSGGTTKESSYFAYFDVFSVPTLGEILIWVFIGILVIGLAWSLRRKRQWLLYYFVGAFSSILATVIISRHFGFDQYLVNLASYHLYTLNKYLFHLPLELLSNGRIQLLVPGNSSILQLGIECSAILEMSIAFWLMVFYPLFGRAQRILRAIFGVVVTYLINILRLFIIIFIAYRFGSEYIFIAHAAVARVVFFIAELILYWYLITKPTVKSVGESIMQKTTVAEAAKVGHALKLKHALAQAIIILVVVGLGLLSFRVSDDWQKAFYKTARKETPAILGEVSETVEDISIKDLDPNKTATYSFGFAQDRSLNLKIVEGKKPAMIEVYLNDKFQNRAIITEKADEPIIEEIVFQKTLDVSADDVMKIKITNLGDKTSDYLIYLLE